MEHCILLSDVHIKYIPFSKLRFSIWPMVFHSMSHSNQYFSLDKCVSQKRGSNSILFSSFFLVTMDSFEVPKPAEPDKTEEIKSESQ